MLQRAKPAIGPGASQSKNIKKNNKLPKLEEFLTSRNYTGAITLLEVINNYKDFVYSYEK